MINVKGTGALATMLKQEEKTAWLERQSPRVQQWASRYETDKQARIDELAELSREVANAEVKFASKRQRRVIIAQPKTSPSVVRIKHKATRRIRVNPETEGLPIYRFRWNNIKRLLREKRDNGWIPRCYLYFGSYENMRNDKVIANDIIFVKKMIKSMGFWY